MNSLLFYGNVCCPFMGLLLHTTKYSNHDSVRILPFSIAEMENNILPVASKIIPTMAVAIVMNNLLVRSTVTYRLDEK